MGKLFFTTHAKPFMGKIHDLHWNCNVPFVIYGGIIPLQIPKVIGSLHSDLQRIYKKLTNLSLSKQPVQIDHF